MQWTDSAILLSTQKYGENASIITVLSEQHGLYKGLVRGITSKKNRGIYQVGNVLDITWRGRLSEHLGQFSAELSEPITAYIMDEPEKLAALTALCSILEATLAEREPHATLYHKLSALLSLFKQDSLHWLFYYVRFEIDLLSELGFGLDLTTCAATGETENLTYVSPKSGRAVSASAGEPYKEKLLKLPEFLLEGEFSVENHHEIAQGLAISSYFLDKYIFSTHNASLPACRGRFEEMLLTKEF